jgi:hypothetical protein
MLEHRILALAMLDHGGQNMESSEEIQHIKLTMNDYLRIRNTEQNNIEKIIRENTICCAVKQQL